MVLCSSEIRPSEYPSEKIGQFFYVGQNLQSSQNNLFLNPLVLGHRNQISHPSGNLEKKRHDLPPVSFGKASSPQLVLDSSLGHRDRAVRVQVFIVLGFVVAIPFC